MERKQLKRALFLEFLLRKVVDDPGPFQNLPTFQHNLATLFQKIEFVCRISLHAVQLINKILRLVHVLLAEPPVICFVIISFKIELVDFYQFGRLLLVLQLLFEALVFLLVAVHAVGSTCVFVAMVVRKTQPTKRMLTL